MFTSLQAGLQQYVNQELPDVQGGFRKGRGTGDQIANICWVIEKAREFQNNIYFCLIVNAEAFDWVDHSKLENPVVFPVVMYECESWTIKKVEHWRIVVFELWCWRRLLRVPWTARRSNQSILKEINPEYSLKGLMLKLQYFGHLMWRADSLQPHESQHTRPPCPSPTPRVHWDSHSSSQWCHPAISSSVIPFSSCPQSLPASESFPMSKLFTWGGQNTGISALASFLPKKSQGWSPSEWIGWISLHPRDAQESSPTPKFKSINSSALSLLHSPTLTSIHDHRKNHSLD